MPKLSALTDDKQNPWLQSTPTRSQLPTSQSVQLLVNGMMAHGYCFEPAVLVDFARVVEAAAQASLTQLKKYLFSRHYSFSQPVYCRSSFRSSLSADRLLRHDPSMRPPGSVLTVVAIRIAWPEQLPPK